MSDDVDLGRRQLLTTATALTGAVGAVFVATPFLASWKPSARAKALGAPVEIDISKLELGAMLKVEWRGKPVWVVRRTPEMLASLKTDTAMLAGLAATNAPATARFSSKRVGIRTTWRQRASIAGDSPDRSGPST